MKTVSAASPAEVRVPPFVWRPVLWFGVFACGLTWSVRMPEPLARFVFGAYPFPPWAYHVALFGPAIAAVMVSAAYEGTAGLRRLATTLRPRGPWRWYAFALLGPAASFGVVVGIVALTGGAFPAGEAWLLALRQTLWLTPLFLREELGWRGFLLPHLTHSQSPLAATGGTALLWALWHVPAYATHPTLLNWLLLVAGIFPISVLHSLLFLRTRSLLPCLLLHSAIDCGWARLLVGSVKEDYPLALALWLGVLWLMAIPAIVALAKGRPRDPGAGPARA